MARMKIKSKKLGHPAVSSGANSTVNRLEKKLAQALNGLKQQYQKGSDVIAKQISRTEAKLAKLQHNLEKAKAKSNKQRSKTLTQTIQALRGALKGQQRMLVNYRKEYQQLLAKSEVGFGEKVEKKMRTSSAAKRSKKAKTGRRGRPTKAIEMVAPNIAESSATSARATPATDTWAEERAKQTSEVEELETSEV